MTFGNDVAKNVVIFSVHNSSSSHTDNQKNDFFVLGGRPTDGVNDSTGTVGKKLIFYFSKAKTKLLKFTQRQNCLSLHYNGDESYLYVIK